VLNAFTIRLAGSWSASRSAELVDGSIPSRIHDSSSGLLISTTIFPSSWAAFAGEIGRARIPEREHDDVRCERV